MVFDPIWCHGHPHRDQYRLRMVKDVVVNKGKSIKWVPSVLFRNFDELAFVLQLFFFVDVHGDVHFYVFKTVLIVSPKSFNSIYSQNLWTLLFIHSYVFQ